jgi:hypothetical protein
MSKGGRGHWHSTDSINDWLLGCAKRGTVINIVCELTTRGEYQGIKNRTEWSLSTRPNVTGVAVGNALLKSLEKEGLKKDEAKAVIGDLLRSGDLYEPREGFYKTTTDCGQLKKEVDDKAKRLDVPTFCSLKAEKTKAK